MTALADPAPSDPRPALRSCLDVPRWVERVADGAPYASVAALLAEASAAADPLAPDEIEAALADHPRIGERHAGSGRSAAFSAAEQSASGSADAALAARLVDGNRAYEERFGRVFLIRARGRERVEIVDELERRLGNDDATEIVETGVQLREIALLRLTALVEEEAGGGLLAAAARGAEPDAVSPAAGTPVATTPAATTPADPRTEETRP